MNQAPPRRLAYALAIVYMISCLAQITAANAAVEVQPDIRVGASHIYVDTVAGDQSVSETGGQIDAEIRFAFFDERGEFAIVPMVSQTFYKESDSLDREEERVTLLWNREYRTGDVDLLLDFSRLDMFSSEFEDVNTDPIGGDGSAGSDSGIVGLGTRDQIQFAGSLAKQVSRRSSLLANFDAVDVHYDEEQGASRIDFSQLLLTAGWRLQVSERSSWTVLAGGRDYAGENDVDVRSYRGDLRFETELSPKLVFFAAAGFESLEAEQLGLEIASEDVVPFAIGFRSTAERTRYRLTVDRIVTPISTGRFQERTRALFMIDHELTQLLTVSFGVIGYRDEQLNSSVSGNDRDYIGTTLDLDWALGRRWSLGFEYYRNEQDFSDPDSNPNEIRSRDELFLNLRYRGLSKSGSK